MNEKVQPVERRVAEIRGRLSAFLAGNEDYVLIARHFKDTSKDRDITGDVEDLLSLVHQPPVSGWCEECCGHDLKWRDERGECNYAANPDHLPRGHRCVIPATGATTEREEAKASIDHENRTRFMEHFWMKVEPHYIRKHGHPPPEQSALWELLQFVVNTLEPIAATDPRCSICGLTQHGFKEDQDHEFVATTGTSVGEQPDVCWHCKVVLSHVPKPRCEDCPEECDVEGCEADGCTTAPAAKDGRSGFKCLWPNAPHTAFCDGSQHGDAATTGETAQFDRDFEAWQEKMKANIERTEQSEILTAEDYNIRINARDDDPPSTIAPGEGAKEVDGARRCGFCLKSEREVETLVKAYVYICNECQALSPTEPTQAGVEADLISRKAAIEIAQARLKDVPDTVDLEADRSLFAAGYLAAAGSIKAALERAAPAEAGEVERLSGLAESQRLSHQEDSSMTKDYDGFRAGMLRAAEMARNEFKRAPEAAKGDDCVWMGGYESACDHLSVVIAQAAVIDSVRIAGAQPDWQYHIALLLPDGGVDDQALLKIYQVVEHELRVAHSTTIQSCIDIVNRASVIPFDEVPYVSRDEVLERLEALVKGEGEDGPNVES